MIEEILSIQKSTLDIQGKAIELIAENAKDITQIQYSILLLAVAGLGLTIVYYFLQRRVDKLSQKLSTLQSNTKAQNKSKGLQ